MYLSCGEAKQHATHATRNCDLLGWGICSPSAQSYWNCQDSSRCYQRRETLGLHIQEVYMTRTQHFSESQVLLRLVQECPSRMQLWDKAYKFSELWALLGWAVPWNLTCSLDPSWAFLYWCLWIILPLTDCLFLTHEHAKA